MSHHLDSPASRRDPRLNVTDLYVFDGQTGTILAMVVNTSLAGAGRTPGFHPEGRYEFKVHFGGEPRESLTYRFVFGEMEDGDQSVDLCRLTGADARRDDAAGTLLASGRTGAVMDGPDGLRAWAGAAADPFNGRSLADNAPEVMYGLVTNSALPTGLRSSDAAETRQDEFPYVVPAKQ